ncbi:MAG TPA: FxsC protein [Pyrinomonadaceae bacterium]|nr:FxsC protein [Pyrinomonadaceae bacterium]
MGYDFFFSYKRVVDLAYLKQFFDDLSDEVRAQREAPSSQPIGFFDIKDVEQGDEWEPTLATALQDSAVLVSVYSMKYFQSEYCGKEFQVFQMRREEYRNSKLAEGELEPQLPPVIKPVLWMPLASDLDPKLKKLQYTWGDPNDIQNRDGLRYVLQLKSKYETEYKEYIIRLAKEIIEVSDKYKLPKLRNLPDLRQVTSAFKAVTQPAAVSVNKPTQTTRTSSKHVRFIFAAAEPELFAGKRGNEAYRDNGGADWKPFYPQVTRRIGSLVQNIVSADDLDFSSDELPLDKNLIKEIEKAYDERKIVVILVDGWTVAYKDEYRAILKEFDEEIKSKYINYSVLVPWNEGDPDNDEKKKSDILGQVQQTLSFRSEKLAHTAFYHDSINTVEKLRDVLREVLVKIPSEMHKKVENVNNMPSTIAKPIVSADPGSVGV